MTKELTEKQQAFLNALFSEGCGGRIRKAMDIAGYSKNTPAVDVVEPLQEEIEARTRKFIATSGPEAAYSIVSVLSNPTALGNKDKIAAAKDLLDRAGFKPKEEIEIKAENPLFILPAKQDGKT